MKLVRNDGTNILFVWRYNLYYKICVLWAHPINSIKVFMYHYTSSLFEFVKWDAYMINSSKSTYSLTSVLWICYIRWIICDAKISRMWNLHYRFWCNRLWKMHISTNVTSGMLDVVHYVWTSVHHTITTPFTFQDDDHTKFWLKTSWVFLVI
jgi:hypothetical protein